MNQLIAFWRDSWKLWTGFSAVVVVMAAIQHWFFLVILLFLVVEFSYFAIMRYDEDGNKRDAAS
jgi:hypothetical protein